MNRSWLFSRSFYRFIRIWMVANLIASLLSGVVAPPAIDQLAGTILSQTASIPVTATLSTLLPTARSAQAATSEMPVARAMNHPVQAAPAQVVSGSKTLTITKSVSGTEPVGQVYSVTVTGPSYPSGQVYTVTNGSTRLLTALADGMYTVTESSPGSHWTTSYSVANGYSTGSSAVVTLTNTPATRFTLSGPITGTVYNDYNSDGTLTDDGTLFDMGVSGVTVTVYALDGSLLASTQSNASGQYTITAASLAVQGPYRVEFSNLPKYYEPSRVLAGTQNGTSVQFIETATQASALNLGLLRPSQYVGTELGIAVAINQIGAAVTRTNTAGDDYAFISLPYTSTGVITGSASGDVNQPDFAHDASAAQLGSLWGVAYQPNSGRIFSSAFLKRHTDLGPLVRPALNAGVQAVPVDGIYMLDYGYDTGGTPLGGFTLNNVTPAIGSLINTGVVSREIIGVVVTSTRPYALSTVALESLDADAFGKVGKVGFGDMDMAKDGRYLWVVNLNQKSLIRLDAANAAALPTSGAISGALLAHYPINFSGLPACSGEFRPWGLGFTEETGYLGVVCDASTGTSANLRAYVLSFNPNTVSAFTPVLTVNLDPATYKRESAQFLTGNPTCLLGTQEGWNRWTDTFSNLGATGERACPQPILSDIDFTENGDLILSFIDRTSEQRDRNNWSTTSTVGTYTVDPGGDTLLACTTTSGFVLEGFSDCVIDSDTFGSAAGSGTTRPSTVDGPNAVGEFFFDDYPSSTALTTTLHHAENNLGALLVVPGTHEVLVSTYDPIDGDFTQGLQWYRTRTNPSGTPGRLSDQYQFNNARTGSLATKGARLGDIELLVPPAPIEIGNRVWDDLDGDGLQDPGEPGLSGVQVNLTNPNGTAITTTTDLNGNYYFTREATTGAYSTTLRPNATYTLSINTSPAGYTLTTVNAESISTNTAITDVRDSDARFISGKATLTYTTGTVGQTNHGLDFGFTKTGGQVNILNTAPVQIGNRLWAENDNDGNATTGTVSPLTGQVVTATDGTTIYTATTNSGGFYTITLPANRTYTVTTALPIGYFDTPTLGGNTGANPASNNDKNHDRTSTTVIMTMTDNLSIDFGFQTPSMVQGRLYEDVNGDGIYNGADLPLVGVSLRITDSDGVTYTLTSDSNGAFSSTVPAGTTTVDVVDGTLAAGLSLLNGKSDPQTVSVPVGGTATTDFPYVKPLTIDKDSLTSNVTAGMPITYQVVLRNVGGQLLTGVSLSDTLATSFTYASSSIQVISATRTVTSNPTVGSTAPVWSGWTISPSGAITVTFVVTVSSSVLPGSYDNTAYATSDQTGLVDDDGLVAQDANTPFGQDPEADEDVTVVTSADLSVYKSDTPDPVSAGGLLTYTIAVTNIGPSNAQNVRITDTLPVSLTYLSYQSTTATCSEVSPNLVVCTLSTVAAGAVPTITLVVRVEPTLLAVGDTPSNKAMVDAGKVDSLAEKSKDNSSSATQPEVAVQKRNRAVGKEVG